MNYAIKVNSILSQLEKDLDTHHNCLIRELSEINIPEDKIVNYIPLKPNTTKINKVISINNSFKNTIDTFEEKLQELTALKHVCSGSYTSYKQALDKSREIQNSQDLLEICEFDEELLNTSQQLIYIRNDIRHRNSTARQDLTLSLISIKATIDNQEIKSSILSLQEKKTLSITNQKLSRVIKKGVKISITEEEIQNTIYTVKLILIAIINNLSKKYPHIPHANLQTTFGATSAYL